MILIIESKVKSNGYFVGVSIYHSLSRYFPLGFFSIGARSIDC